MTEGQYAASLEVYMTSVIAVSDGKSVWLAGDSFCGDEKKKDICKSSKVYKIGPLGIGLCGMVRQELILEKILRNLIEKQNVIVSHDWLKFELPDILCKEMKDRFGTVDKNGQATLGESAYMLAFDGVIYYLDDDFGIWDSQRSIAGIGAGKQYTLGALKSMMLYCPNMTIEQKMKNALEIAHEWSIWVEPPYTLVKI